MKLGLVASYSGPAGNVTGVDLFSGTVGPKRLKMVRELVPQTEPPSEPVRCDVLSSRAAVAWRELTVDREHLVRHPLTGDASAGFHRTDCGFPVLNGFGKHRA
jgi:hypothetical protein